jgi:uncharacterized protein
MLPWLLALAMTATGALAYGWFEAGWLRTRVLDVEVPGLPASLDGVRIVHLSDFHLGGLGRGRVASERGVAWAIERAADLVCVTGDLLSRPRGEPQLRLLLERLGRPYVVLGNHDIAVTRDPFSAAAELDDLRGAALLRDAGEIVELRGCRVQIVGVDPRSYRDRRSDPVRLADVTADFRILLCHYPRVVRRLPAGVYHLVLAGHLHAGQIVLPYPGGRLTLAHPRAREVVGIYRFGDTVLHVSPGLGTSFLPLRFFARPEVTQLVLRAER